MRTFAERLGPPLVLAALVVAFFPHLAALNHLPAAKDTLTFSYAAQCELARALRSGHFPLWSAHLNSPLFAEGQGGFAHPLALLLFALLPPAAASDLFLLLHVYAGLLFTYALARELGQSRLSALVAAPAFGLSGFFLARLGIYTIITNGCWLPGLLWFAHRFGRTRDFRWAMAGVAGGALALLAGQFQLASYAIVAAALYAFVSSRDRKAGLVGAALFLLLPLAAAAVQLVPTFELWRLSTRAGDARPGDYSFWPPQYLTLLLPDIFGRAPHPAFAPFGAPQPHGYWGRGSFVEAAFFVGAAPLALAAVGIIKRPRWYLLAWGALAVIFATGVYTPLFKVYEIIPPFGLFRAPSRLLLYATLTLAVAAGDGLDVLRRSRTRLGFYVGVALLALATTTVAAFRLSLPVLEKRLAVEAAAKAAAAPAAAGARGDFRAYYNNRAREVFRKAAANASLRRTATTARLTFLAVTALLLWLASRGARLARLTAAAFFLLTASDLYYYNRELTPTVPAARVDRPPAVAAAFTDATAYRVYANGFDLGPETTLGLGLVHENTHAIWGYNLVVPRASLKTATEVSVFRRLEDLYTTRPGPGGYRLVRPTVPPLGLFSACGVKYFVRLAPWLGGAVTSRGRYGPYFVYENAAALPLVRAVTSYRLIPDGDAAFAALTQGGPGNAAVLEEAPAGFTPGGAPPRVISYRPSPTELSCRVAGAAPSLLVVSDLYYPGWRATVDGRAAKIYRADVLGRAVAVPAGRHNVRFMYRPLSFYIGLACTVVTVLLLAFATLAISRRRRET